MISYCSFISFLDTDGVESWHRWKNDLILDWKLKGESLFDPSRGVRIDECVPEVPAPSSAGQQRPQKLMNTLIV